MNEKIQKEEFQNKTWNVMKSIGTCMLVTKDGDQLRARPMQLVQNEYSGKLWLFTQLDSGKTDEIIDDSHACVSFADSKNHSYVSLSGTIKITKDQSLIDQFWSSSVSSWFPDGKESPSCALLEVTVHKGEHWDSDTNTLGYIFEMAKASMTNKKPDLGENRKF